MWLFYESIPHFCNFVPASRWLSVLLEVFPTLRHSGRRVQPGLAPHSRLSDCGRTVTATARCGRRLAILSPDRSDPTSCLRLLRRKWGLSLPVAAHLELILLELQQVRVVRAQQEDAAAFVRVGVGDLPGAAAPTADGNAHLEGLQTRTRSQGQNGS